MFEGYDPRDWHWIIGGDASRAWSSATAGWVSRWPAERVTRIASEAELSEVLRGYGLRGPLVTAADVRAEAQRRIIVLTGAADLNGCLVRQLNALMRATELTNKVASGSKWSASEAAEAARLEALAAAIKAVRAASNLLEPEPPADYTSDAHWPEPA
jgi:hypothetical protein